MVPPTVQGARGICFGCGAPLVVPVNTPRVLDAELVFQAGDQVANRYEIIERLGAGGMGVVYSAHDQLVGERVALKFMKPKLLRTPQGQRMFIREAQVARRLRHDHIVAVHDVDRTSDGILYLTMELIEGRPLRAIIRESRKNQRYLPVRYCVSILEQILSALEYAHKTVIHRDMKPENVLVLPGERVKVLDFGLAKAVDEEEKIRHSDRKEKRVVGTKEYAAPEQIRYQPVDLRADIYASGLLLRELLTLHTPVDPPCDWAQIRDDVAPSIMAALDKALQEDRENRWPSAGAFRDSLLQAYRDSYAPQAASSIETGGRKASTKGMVYLEGGSFIMGSNEFAEAAPERELHIEPFYIDIYPVTVSQYMAFVEDTGSPKPRYWDHPQFMGAQQPIVGVSWEEAHAYAHWAGKELPLEEEWEFAARGREGRLYPWGTVEPDPTRANFGDHLNMPSIVGMHEDGATPEHIHDLAGNVYEWTASPFAEPGGASSAPARRVIRGGCWHSGADTLRASHRRGLFTETRANTLGFRCVLRPRSLADKKT